MNLYIKRHIRLSFKSSAEISDFYRSMQIDYPKFFKMDGLSKLGLIASETLLNDKENRFEPCEDTAVICFNRSSSLEIDTKYQGTISDDKNYFPSPSLFVYTLPNIVTGEIAIRNKFLGETSFYISENFNATQMVEIVENAFFDKSTRQVLLGWIENFEGNYEVLMAFVTTEKCDMEFTKEQLKKAKNGICSIVSVIEKKESITGGEN